MASTLLISPHLDDATLSCGGTISRLVSGGHDVTVVTVCTADDEGTDRPSPLARRSHAAWGLGPMPFAPRRDEDVEALRLLGAHGVYLGLTDAVYRRDAEGRPLYRKPVRVPIHPHDLGGFLASARDALRAVFADSPDALVVSPLGLGGHVDHLLVRSAVEDLREVRDLVYYEEYPYLTGDADVHPSPHMGVRRDLTLLAPTPDEFEARIEAIACYRSQLRGLFPTLPERVREILAARVPVVGPLLNCEDGMAPVDRVRTRLRRDVAECGGERFWCTPDSPFLSMVALPVVLPPGEGSRERVTSRSTRGYSRSGSPLGTRS